ncbi:MAG TPA: M23 family metallopeptidase [Candidatus Saccharibacteria bacterium]|nr:M23 family metallopeptidase [Candidatus Saccharibacteria bacterium]
MKKNFSEAGMAHVLLVVLVVVIAAIGAVGYRVITKKEADKPKPPTSNTNNTPGTKESADLALQNIGLQSFDDILYTKNAVREYASNGLKGFYVFGDKLSGGRVNPNFEFSSIKPGSKVVSAIDGVVAFIKEQPDSKDYEVFVQLPNNTVWTIGYDHLVNLSVKKDDVVKAGTVLGEPAIQNNGLHRFEIQVNKDENGTTTHICPSTLLASAVKDKVLGDLTAMQNTWESSTGLDLYSVDAQKPVGCLKQGLTVAEAEGR